MLKFNIYPYCLLLFLLSSCFQNNKDNQPVTITYFDIKGFFEEEAVRLAQENPIVSKTIVKNSVKEEKLIKIKNWKQELDLFMESDINKPSWTSSYNIKENGDTTLYTALTPDLRTREIQIVKKGNHIHSLTIKNKVRNKLYESSENLFYFPDSIYRIDKSQDVKVIGINNYSINVSF